MDLRVAQRCQRVPAEQQPLVIAGGLEGVHAQDVTTSSEEKTAPLTHNALSTTSGLRGDDERESATRPSTML